MQLIRVCGNLLSILCAHFKQCGEEKEKFNAPVSEKLLF